MREYALDKRNGVSDLVFWDLDRFTRNIQHFFTDTEKTVKCRNQPSPCIGKRGIQLPHPGKSGMPGSSPLRQSRGGSPREPNEDRERPPKRGRHIGKAPWGYILVYESDELDEKGNPVSCGRLEPDPELWPHVLKLWDIAKDGFTPMKIAKYNNDHNVPSPSGQPWTDGTVRYILKNEKYYGKLFRGVKPQTRLPGPKENAPAIILEDSHTPAVDFSNWQKINNQIKSRHRDQSPTRCYSSPNAPERPHEMRPLQSPGIRLQPGTPQAEGHSPAALLPKKEDRRLRLRLQGRPYSTASWEPLLTG